MLHFYRSQNKTDIAKSTPKLRDNSDINPSKCPKIQGVSKKRNTFDLEYLKDGLTKLIVLLVCYSVLPYNSIEPNFSFL